MFRRAATRPPRAPNDLRSVEEIHAAARRKYPRGLDDEDDVRELDEAVAVRDDIARLERELAELRPIAAKVDAIDARVDELAAAVTAPVEAPVEPAEG